MGTPEQSPKENLEQLAGSEVAQEQLEKLGSQESAPDKKVERSAEKAKQEAMESALSVEAGGKEKAGKENNSSTKPRKPSTKKQREESFRRRMKDVQSDMKAPQRTFSRLIHNRVVEKTSEVVGSTVARPNAILAGAFSAFVLTLLVYVVSKSLGYRLSGFEAIGAFILGWVIGIVYDYLKLIITGKK